VMAGVKLLVGLVVVIISVGIGGKWAVGAEVQHVVGGDSGWHPSSDLGSWSAGRIFRVGDKIWFTYPASQDTVVEVESMEEYLACDVSNPIKMYTGGLDILTLANEGVRYFVSGKLESCKSGLKLHVVATPEAVADGPTTPSASAQLYGLSQVLFGGLLVCYLGL